MKAAFLIGVSVYNSLRDLPACTKDVSIIESLLKATGNYDKIEVLKDDTNSDTVKSVFRNFVRELKEQEEVVQELFIYFSGHGFQNKEDLFLLCTDYDDRRSKTTSFPNTELDELIRTISPVLTVKIFDACQSGYQYIKDTSVFEKNWSQQHKINKLIAMASCLEQEKSWANEQISFFTKAFFEGATNKKLGDNIYYRDIQSYIADSFASSSRQTPYFTTQIDGLEIFGTANKKIKDLQAKHQTLIEQTVKSKSLIDRIIESVNERESYFLPREKVDNLLKQIEPSELTLNFSDEIIQKLYKVKEIESISLKDISSAKLIAEKISDNKWKSECFVTVQQEPYQARELREDLPFLTRMETSINPFNRNKIPRSDDNYYKTITKHRACGVNIDFSLPFDCLQLQIQSDKLSLHPWNSYLFLIPARTYCVLVMGFIKLNRHSWNEFELQSSKIDWLFEELLWRDWAKHPPIQTLMTEIERRIKKDILQTCGIEFESE